MYPSDRLPRSNFRAAGNAVIGSTNSSADFRAYSVRPKIVLCLSRMASLSNSAVLLQPSCETLFAPQTRDVAHWPFLSFLEWSTDAVRRWIDSSGRNPSGDFRKP